MLPNPKPNPKGRRWCWRPSYLSRLSWYRWLFWLQFGGGDVDLVLNTAFGSAPLRGLSDRTDEVLSDPEGLVQLVTGHPLTQLLQHQAPVAVTRPHTLGQDDQTL